MNFGASKDVPMEALDFVKKRVRLNLMTKFSFRKIVTTFRIGALVPWYKSPPPLKLQGQFGLV